jgi:uncharacterized membrane protein YqjE
MTERDVSAVRVEQTSGNIGAGTDVTQHSVGELVKEVTSDLMKLFNQELALAKLELSNEAKKAGKTAGAYAGAGVAGYFLVLFASLTLMFALASLFDSYVWAALAVTVLWAIVGPCSTARPRRPPHSSTPSQR